MVTDRFLKITYIPGRSHITKIPPYFFDHSEVAPRLSFLLSSSILPRNIDVAGPGRFRSGDISASKNKNLQLSHAIMRVGTARRANFHSIISRTNNSNAAIDIIFRRRLRDNVCTLRHFYKKGPHCVHVRFTGYLFINKLFSCYTYYNNNNKNNYNYNNNTKKGKASELLLIFTSFLKCL